jgi:hypothetical protein
MTDINHRYSGWLGKRREEEFLDELRVYVFDCLDVAIISDGNFAGRIAQLVQDATRKILAEDFQFDGHTCGPTETTPKSCVKCMQETDHYDNRDAEYLRADLPGE